MDAVTATLITGAIGTVCGVFGKTFIDWIKEKNQYKKSNNEQAFALYNDLIIKMGAQITKLELRIAEIEKKHFDCQEENLKLQGKIAALEEKVTLSQ